MSSISPARQRELLRAQIAQEELLKRSIQTSMLSWSKFVLQADNQAPAKHHELIIEYLEKVTSGDIDRLMIFAPPGSAKSSYVSWLFPAYFLARYPKAKIIGASHTADFAERWSAKVRSLIDEHGEKLGYTLKDDSRNKQLWETTETGEYKSIGVGGAISGFRGDLIILDDIVKGWDSVQSETTRNGTFDWLTTDILTRLKPGGRIVLVMTRWHEDDVAGRLLEHEPDRWTVLKLPVFCENEASDPLGRQLGEVLWPEWETAAMIEDKKRTMGEIRFNGLFQQRPSSAEGSIFRPGLMPVITVPIPDPKTVVVRAWDLASSLKGDWTVGVKLARYPDGRFTVLDVIRFRGGPDEVEARIVATAQADGTDVKISIPRDPGQAGASQAMYLTRKLAGFRVASTPDSGAKEVRAMPLSAQVNAGNVSIVHALWNEAFKSELAVFPSGKYDDQVDACSRAFNDLIVVKRPTGVCRLDFMSR